MGEHLGSYLWLIKGMWGSSLIVVVVLGGVILCVQVPMRLDEDGATLLHGWPAGD